MNKTVLITGGSRGIGKSIAISFAKIGYNVVVTSRSKNESSDDFIKNIESYGVKCLMIFCDFTEKNSVELLFNEFDKEFTNLDVLINNAGWTKYIKHEKIDELNEELFENIINVNLKSAFFCSKMAIQRMNGDNNCIINISSIAGFTGLGSNIIYCASKAGLISFTKSFARAFGDKVRVNSVAPGLTETNMTQSGPKIYKENEIKNTPMKKIAVPNDISDVVISLVTEMKFINGQTIIVDGGRFLNY